MLTLVYFSPALQDGSQDILTGAFLMEEDADVFIKGSAMTDLKKVTAETEAWEHWRAIRQYLPKP